MCGIAGWVDWDRDLSKESAVIERMTDTMVRRGPDDRGTWLAKHVALGHRRLSIIDPANGKQPMVYSDGTRTVVIVYNGELYNFLALRSELESRGHTFRTRCDTEVLLHAYLEWGADCVPRFDGIFAFAIWDEGKQRLFLARDRLGVKPLFIAERGSSFLFGSEIKALLANELVKPEVDGDGLIEAFMAAPPFYLASPGETPFRGIRELRPGRTLTVERGKIDERTYWKLSSKPHTDDFDTTVERVRELFEGAVIRQLVSDVPLACLLSGGLDSSGIAAIAQRELKKGSALQTWVVDFVGAENDFIKYDFLPSRDAPFAAEAAAYLGADHHPVVLETEAMLDNLLDVMRCRDVPGGSQRDTSLLLLFREMKKMATVALSGEAGDEVFGGYVWFSPEEKRNTFPWMRPDRTIPLSAAFRDRLDFLAYRDRRYEETLSEVPRLASDSASAAKWREKIFIGQTRWLPYLLTRKDRIGMYAGIEGRVPFCDHALVEYMWNVPRELQMVDGVEKTLLRKALDGLLPPSIANRKKSVFPFFENVSYTDGVRARARDVLADPNSPARAVWDVDMLKRRADGERDGSTASTAVEHLEHFLQFDAWLREYRIAIV
jgi:asparagine synthase (glutamine-hydrolysing)